MRLTALQHMKLAKAIRHHAPKLPQHKRARALKLAGLGQMLARAQAKNPSLAPQSVKSVNQELAENPESLSPNQEPKENPSISSLAQSTSPQPSSPSDEPQNA
jgi:hypothetical protein